MNQEFNTPILFIIFNRLNTTQKVFEVIREIRPKKLFVAADGYRLGVEGEKDKCDEVKKYVLDNIDWPCEIKTLFREKNLGCGKAVSSAITWFFENVEEGIILEDECVPNKDFFVYCEELLNYYRDNKEIMVIGGNNFQNGVKRGDASYYFSAFSHIWGWATWARAWKLYDFKLENIKEEDLDSLLGYYFLNKSHVKYWKYIFKKLKSGAIDTWDYQLLFTIWENKLLAIVPNVNLVSNIGFGGGTHTRDIKDIAANMAKYEILPIIHPAKIELCREADDYYYKIFLKSSFFKKIKDKIKMLIV